MREFCIGMQKIYSEFIYKILDADKKWIIDMILRREKTRKGSPVLWKLMVLAAQSLD